MKADDFFIGWAETPKQDRRFMLGATLGLIAGGADGPAAIAAAIEAARLKAITESLANFHRQ